MRTAGDRPARKRFRESETHTYCRPTRSITHRPPIIPAFFRTCVVRRRHMQWPKGKASSIFLHVRPCLGFLCHGQKANEMIPPFTTGLQRACCGGVGSEPNWTLWIYFFWFWGIMRAAGCCPAFHGSAEVVVSCLGNLGVVITATPTSLARR